MISFPFSWTARDLNPGDTIYYVREHDGQYVIRKTGIQEIRSGVPSECRSLMSRMFSHAVILTDNGAQLDDGSPIFRSRKEAIQYIVEQLRAEVNWAEITLHNAQHDLARLQRTLTMYSNQLAQLK